jgi:uncharacterized membrane protein
MSAISFGLFFVFSAARLVARSEIHGMRQGVGFFNTCQLALERLEQDVKLDPLMRYFVKYWRVVPIL